MSSGNFVLAKSHLIISPFFSLTEFPWAKDQPDEIVFFFFNTEMLYDAMFTPIFPIYLSFADVRVHEIGLFSYS